MCEHVNAWRELGCTQPWATRHMTSQPKTNNSMPVMLALASCGMRHDGRVLLVLCFVSFVVRLAGTDQPAACSIGKVEHDGNSISRRWPCHARERPRAAQPPCTSTRQRRHKVTTAQPDERCVFVCHLLCVAAIMKRLGERGTEVMRWCALLRQHLVEDTGVNRRGRLRIQVQRLLKSPHSGHREVHLLCRRCSTWRCVVGWLVQRHDEHSCEKKRARTATCTQAV
jgi:hypothetical protein